MASLTNAIREAGISRVADVTGLDCIGIPVWQAIRPWSLALTVHQGKGFTDAEARRGAIMEGLESHHAEQWRTSTARPASLAMRHAQSWSALPQSSRSPTLDDWARHCGAINALQPLDWFGVEAIGPSPDFYAPVEAIHLDFTQSLDHGVAASSNGQAAHFSIEAATLAGLFELIERDACAEWLAGSPVARAGHEIAISSIADPAVQNIYTVATARKIGVRLYRVPAIAGITVIAAELADFGANRTGHTHVLGSAARFDPAEAVVAALLEALQTRCTEIAGGRDTVPLFNAMISGRTSSSPLGLPVRPGWSGHALEPKGDSPCCLAGLIEAIAAAGYRQIGRVILSPENSVAITVKTFIPGLGYEQRRRRI